MRLTLTPGTPTAGGPKRFEVVSAQLETTTGKLTVTCRDGRVCLGLAGPWQVETTASSILPMGCDEVERIHDGRGLVLVN